MKPTSFPVIVIKLASLPVFILKLASLPVIVIKLASLLVFILQNVGAADPAARGALRTTPPTKLRNI